ncbi:MAG TPA: sigma-70 family RNA polymerase sigma factor [Patescibacteria group bacterium]|nr:sigma-70 family RNA polymerase sigma factor [Patescibacteria group bacterium]
MQLNEYLQELKNVVLLTLEEERTLWAGYKETGDLQCRRRIIESYQPLVFKVAMKWRLEEGVLMDVIQEGTVGLIEAVEGFDYKRGVAFSLFASHRIRGRMLNFLEREGAQILRKDQRDDADRLAECLIDADAEITGQVEHSFLMEQIQTALQRLPRNEQLILNGVFVKECEPKELAAELDVSLSHIYRLQKKGIRRLRGMLSKLIGNW